jgi:hypothetical protein
MKRKLVMTILIILILFGFSNVNAQQLQAVHSIADPQLAVADVYITFLVFGIPVTLTLDDVDFRTATSTIDASLAAGQVIDVGIAPGSSTSINDTLKNFQVTLVSGNNYLGVVRGVIDPTQFAPNPDGRDTGLDFTLNENARLTSTVPGEVQFFLVHAVTDAPTIDLKIQNGTMLVDNAVYGDMSDYQSLTPATYIFDVTDQSGNTVASFDADLSAYADSAMVVFASGFLDPSQNQNGEEFGLFAALPSGNVIPFPKSLVGIEDEDGHTLADYHLAQNYPNPFNPSTTIEFTIPKQEYVTLAIYDITGKLVQTLLKRHTAAGTHRIQWQPENIPSGVYF